MDPAGAFVISLIFQRAVIVASNFLLRQSGAEFAASFCPEADFVGDSVFE